MTNHGAGEGPQRVPKPNRPIRSFVRREGRLTAAQQRALDELWPRYGIEAEGSLLDLDALFGRAAPKVMEIGIGMGDALAQMAEENPQNDYIGIDVHRPGIGRVMARLDAQGSENVRLFCHDAVEVLQRRIADESLDRVLFFFPDPWHKKRHHKRRLIQPPFVELLRRKLKPGGVLHMATDWQDYAEQMMAVLSNTPGFANEAGKGSYAPRPAYRPVTKFEKRGQRLGHGIWDLLFRRL